MNLAPHPIYNGPYNENGERHGVSDTKEGREFWCRDLLHRDPDAHGVGPAQITRFMDGTTKISFARFGMLHSEGEPAVQRKNQVGDVYAYENWKYGLLDGPAVWQDANETSIVQWKFGKRHGYESKQATGSDIVMLRKWQFGKLANPNGSWTTHRTWQRNWQPGLREAVTGNASVGDHPSKLYTAARSMVELSGSSDSSDVVIAEAREPAPEPEPVKKTTLRQPFRPPRREPTKRETKKPARYRSSHY